MKTSPIPFATLLADLANPDSQVRQNFSVRLEAVTALGGLREARVVDPLIAVLGDGDAGIRWAAVRELDKLGDARAVASLIAALNDENEGVRSAAATALVTLGDARAVVPLIGALGDFWPFLALTEELRLC